MVLHESTFELWPKLLNLRLTTWITVSKKEFIWCVLPLEILVAILSYVFKHLKQSSALSLDSYIVLLLSDCVHIDNFLDTEDTSTLVSLFESKWRLVRRTILLSVRNCRRRHASCLRRSPYSMSLFIFCSINLWQNVFLPLFVISKLCI